MEIENMERESHTGGGRIINSAEYHKENEEEIYVYRTVEMKGTYQRSCKLRVSCRRTYCGNEKGCIKYLL